MNKLIIFDLDGTIADTRADLVLAVNLTRNAYGLCDLTMEEVVNYVGEGRNRLIEQAFHDSQNVDINDACEKWSDFYSKNLIVNTCLYDGSFEGIKAFYEEGYQLAVCSNKPGDMCRKITAHFKIDQYLVTTMGGGDTSTMKPGPESVFEIIKKAESSGFKHEEGNIWMVGDHYTDIRVAENAGIKSIFCNYGFGIKKGLIADYEVEKFSDIAAIVS